MKFFVVDQNLQICQAETPDHIWKVGRFCEKVDGQSRTIGVGGWDAATDNAGFATLAEAVDFMDKVVSTLPPSNAKKCLQLVVRQTRTRVKHNQLPERRNLGGLIDEALEAFPLRFRLLRR